MPPEIRRKAERAMDALEPDMSVEEVRGLLDVTEKGV